MEPSLETITSITAIVKFMELMFPGLLCFMVFQLLSERKLNLYLNIIEIFLYTTIIQTITDNHIYGAIAGLTLGLCLHLLYANDRFFRFMRYLSITNKCIEGDVLWGYLHKNEKRSCIITLKNEDVVKGQIVKNSKDDNHIIVYNPVWLRRKDNPVSESIIIHLYVSLEEVRLIEFKISQKDIDELKSDKP